MANPEGPIDRLPFVEILVDAFWLLARPAFLVLVLLAARGCA